MQNNSVQWLRLELNEGENLQQQSIILHTHFSMFAHALDEGFTIALFRAQNIHRHAQRPVLFIKSDHQEFLNSCHESYHGCFEIAELEHNFGLPKNYELSIGQDLTSQKFSA